MQEGASRAQGDVGHEHQGTRARCLHTRRLVDYKRIKPPADHSASEGFLHEQACWYGPAQVLASVTRSEDGGRDADLPASYG